MDFAASDWRRRTGVRGDQRADGQKRLAQDHPEADRHHPRRQWQRTGSQHPARETRTHRHTSPGIHTQPEFCQN